MTLLQRAQEADRLVKAGLSQRQACAAAGISRNTLARLYRGEDVGGNSKIRYPHLKTRPRRCPSCGGLVFMPCLVCQLQK